MNAMALYTMYVATRPDLAEAWYAYSRAPLHVKPNLLPVLERIEAKYLAARTLRLTAEGARI